MSGYCNNILFYSQESILGNMISYSQCDMIITGYRNVLG